MIAKRRKTFRTIKHLTVASILVAAIGAISPCARAENKAPDPFEMEGIWKSFDRYNDEQKEMLFSGKASSAGNSDTKDSSANAGGNPDTKDAAENAAETTSSQKTANAGELAPPERPLELPVMPGVNQTAAFNLPVSSTENDKSTVHIAHLDSEPDIQLPPQNWLDAARAAQLHAEGKDDETQNIPLHVRMSLLPSLVSTPARKLARTAPAKAMPATETQQATLQPVHAPDQAACAAIDAYHKQQLEAIQSDRHTLTALKDAIKDLGLNKQLDFMVGNDAKIDTPDASGNAKSGAP